MEIQFLLSYINEQDTVLELGCGYGRVLKLIAQKAKSITGIDISEESITFAKEYLKSFSNVELYKMNASDLQVSSIFDVVAVVQNGISAFKIEPEILIKECLKVTKPKGKILLSSYSSKIWVERLEWFKQQANEGLLGEIDLEKTGNGIIRCKDGFVATTFTETDFQSLCDRLNLQYEIKEIDNSSLFCIIEK
ncbi:MAG: class I SAM-dependent methyltransferase [Asgard group archaeon]|nr:class I SAM-dependent methyltransferase [Asgard group archaeon]